MTDEPTPGEVGVYADNVTVWTDEFSLIFDFQVGLPGEGERKATVSRVRIAPRFGLTLLQALGQTLDEYERVHGEIKRPLPTGDPHHG